MHVRGEIAHGGRDARVQGAAERQVPAEAHARRADAAGARRQVQQRAHGQAGVFVVGGEVLRGVGFPSVSRSVGWRSLLEVWGGGWIEREGGGVRTV